MSPYYEGRLHDTSYTILSYFLQKTIQFLLHNLRKTKTSLNPSSKLTQRYASLLHGIAIANRDGIAKRSIALTDGFKIDMDLFAAIFFGSIIYLNSKRLRLREIF